VIYDEFSVRGQDIQPLHFASPHAMQPYNDQTPVEPNHRSCRRGLTLAAIKWAQDAKTKEIMGYTWWTAPDDRQEISEGRECAASSCRRRRPSMNWSSANIPTLNHGEMAAPPPSAPDEGS